MSEPKTDTADFEAGEYYEIDPNVKSDFQSEHFSFSFQTDETVLLPWCPKPTSDGGRPRAWFWQGQMIDRRRAKRIARKIGDETL